MSRMGLTFEIIPADVDEDYLPGESPSEHVTRLSEKKAQKIANDHPARWVLASDTVVVFDGDILGKPADKVEAMSMIRRLSGNVHEVYTGYCVKNLSAAKSMTDYVISKVKIKRITEAEAEFYTDTDEPYDKAGGYAVQGIGAFMVEEIHGSYTNVVGLPLCQVIEAMESLGAIKLF